MFFVFVLLLLLLIYLCERPEGLYNLRTFALQPLGLESEC